MKNVSIRSEKFRSVALVLASGGVAILGGIAYALAADPLGNDQNPTTEEVLTRVRSHAPAVQQEALSDGQVTWEEHEAATTKTIACLRENGVTPVVRPAAGRRPTEILLRASSLEEGERQKDVRDRCEADYYNGVHEAWSAQSRPDSAQAAAGRALFGSCMAKEGVPVPRRTLTEEDLLGWIRDEGTQIYSAKCSVEVYETLGFWP